MAILPGAMNVAELPAPSVLVSFVAPPAAAPAQQSMDGGDEGEERPARVYFAPPSRNEPTTPNLDRPLQPVTLIQATPAVTAPDEGRAGIPTELIDSRPAPRKRLGTRNGAHTGPFQDDGDLIGSDGGIGHAISTQGALAVGGAVSAPEIVEQIRPDYPALAMVERIAGEVVLHAVIDELGNVVDVAAVAGHPVLRESAVIAFKQWRFRPGTLNGKPVKVAFTLTVRFHLKPLEPLPFAPGYAG